MDRNCKPKRGQDREYYWLQRDFAKARIRGGQCSRVEVNIKLAMGHAACARSQQPPGVRLGRG
jgi:hypothetical protein